VFFYQQKALGLVYDKTTAFNDAKHLDVQAMTIYRLENHLKEKRSLKER